MPHRPAKEMFGKRALIITQSLGAGEKSAAKDIKDSLSWWGISYIKNTHFKLMSEIHWDKLPEKKKGQMTRGMAKAARRVGAIDYSRRAHTNLVTKAKFYAVRMLQTGLGKDNPEPSPSAGDLRELPRVPLRGEGSCGAWRPDFPGAAREAP